MSLNQKIEEIRDVIIEAIGQSMSIFGFNATLGRIFGLLYFADQPLSLDEMAKQLMVSKATVSLNIRLLEGLKFAQKIWKKGSRKDFYVAERDFEKNVQEVIKMKTSELNVFKGTVNSVLEKYEAIWRKEVSMEEKVQIEKDILKIQELQNWLATSEKWVEFLMETDLKDGPREDLRRISVEWKDS